MPRLKKNSEGSVSKTELSNLQGLILKCLEMELQQGLKDGAVNQSTIRNALQLLRDNDIVAVEEYEDSLDRLANLLPQLEPVVMSSAASRYS